MNDFENFEPEKLANDVFKNKQRTSTRNGILKAEAVQLFLRSIANENVNYFQDLGNLSEDFEKRIKSIPGQNSGISLQYFYMLAGSDDLIKPDRMVIRYLEGIIKEKVSMESAQNLITDACIELDKSFNIKISPRVLDNAIWNYQRSLG